MVSSKDKSQQRADSPAWLTGTWNVSVSTKVWFIEGTVLWAARLKIWSHDREASGPGATEEISINEEARRIFILLFYLDPRLVFLSCAPIIQPESGQPAGFVGLVVPLLSLPKNPQPSGMNPTCFVSFYNPQNDDFIVRHVAVQALMAMVSHLIITIATIL